MQVTVAKFAGACYGVKRALAMAEEAAASGVPAKTLGPLIHNPRVVASLAEAGVDVAASLDEITEGAVIIRSHGTTPQTIEAARAKGLAVIDATCPHVSKAHNCARELAEAGTPVIVVGEPDHPEVEGIKAWGGQAVVAVVDTPEALPSTLPTHVGVVVQTTQERATFDAVVAALHARGIQVDERPTICFATIQRQTAIRELAAGSDVMIVIGGRNSGNTKRLVEICHANCPRTYHIEDAAEIESAWLAGAERVGVGAGASTPQSHIDAVLERLSQNP